jgi:hypothetical protein
VKTWHRILASVTHTKTIVGAVTVISRQPYMLGAQFVDGICVASVVPVPLVVTVHTMTMQMILSFPTILMTFHSSTVCHI